MRGLTEHERSQVLRNMGKQILYMYDSESGMYVCSYCGKESRTGEGNNHSRICNGERFKQAVMLIRPEVVFLGFIELEL